MNMPNLASWNSWRAFKFSGVGWYVDCADAAKLEKHASARTRNFFKQKLRRVIFLTPMEFSHGHSTTETHYEGFGRYFQTEREVSADEVELTAARTASTVLRLGEREQTGSVAEASPARRSAWQRQPPKSCARRSQDLHGSCIQDSPRNLLKALPASQISRNDFSFTLSNCMPGMTAAA